MATRCFLPSLVLFLCLVSVQSVIYQLKGQQVQFDPDITGQPTEILWIHNGYKVVEFNGNKEQVYGCFRGRVTLDWHSAQLQISDLCIEDSGEYEYETYIQGKFESKSFKLEVLEKVVKPTITCQMNRSSSDMSAVLLCSVELNQTQSSLSFEWMSKGSVQHGPQLTIFLGGELDEEEYICRVSNPASYATAAFIAKDCHTVSDAGFPAGMIAVIGLISIVMICHNAVILLSKLEYINLSAGMIALSVVISILIICVGVPILFTMQQYIGADVPAGMISLIVLIPILFICVNMAIFFWILKYRNLSAGMIALSVVISILIICVGVPILFTMQQYIDAGVSARMIALSVVIPILITCVDVVMFM